MNNPIEELQEEMCEQCGKPNPLKHCRFCPDCKPEGLVHEFMMEIDDYND